MICADDVTRQIIDCPATVDSAFATVLHLAMLIFIVVFATIIARMVVRRAMQYERGVVFRLGKFHRVAGPGLYFLIPIIDTRTVVDLRVDTFEIDKQEMITKDSISLVLSAVIWYKVKDPQAAIIEVADFEDAVDQFSLTTLRNVVGASSLDEVLGERTKVTDRARIMLDEITEKWGVEVQRAEIREIELPDTMKRAMAREAEATREKRARIIKAEAECEASQKLTEAAEEIARHPGAMELRRLQMISEVGAEHNSTVVVSIPQEIMAAAKAIAGT